MQQRLSRIISLVSRMNLLFIASTSLSMEHNLPPLNRPLKPVKTEEIQDLNKPARKRTQVSRQVCIKLISTSQAHQEALKDCLFKTKRKLVISSPLISEKFLNSYFLDWVKTVKSNIIITIYTSEKGAQKLSNLLATSEFSKLNQIIVIKTSNNCPSKTLIVDKKIFINGTYNWLTNIKSSNHLYLSTVIKGFSAKKLIPEALKLLEKNLTIERDASLQSAISVGLSELRLNEDYDKNNSKKHLSISNDVDVVTASLMGLNRETCD